MSEANRRGGMENNNNGGKTKGESSSVIPAKKKSVQKMMAEKLVQIASSAFKNDNKKINPHDDST
ncbi:hypothetical protein H5410_023289 [Solanum commersonii]|uniref:Uncharacterized protein n=1 Tax=Solanum commersonii TaxID=4109 RepID=A0A9J5ZJ26_SOLCO|nr:hypothetical protein H5410_023289 [Solanum commersonii]